MSRKLDNVRFYGKLKLIKNSNHEWEKDKISYICSGHVAVVLLKVVYQNTWEPGPYRYVRAPDKLS